MASTDSLTNLGHVERVRVEEVRPKPTLVSPTPQEAPKASALLAVFAAIAKILAVRLQLLLSLVGAFVIALLAMAWQSYIGLAILGAFCLLTVIPLVWLAWPERSRVV